MSIGNDTFWSYKETRALSGYKSAWLVKLPTAEKYSLIGATESVPYVFGDKESFDFDILQSPTIGQVEGKMSLEAQDVEVLHHRDNAYRFEKLKGKTLDFLVVNAEFVGYKFSGTLDYRPNSAEADVNRATVTITPMTAEDTPVFDARGMIEETLTFANAIPATIKTGDTIDFAVVQSSANVTYSAKSIAAGTNVEADATATVSFVQSKATFSGQGLFAITASAAGFASWTTTVYVEP